MKRTPVRNRLTAGALAMASLASSALAQAPTPPTPKVVDTPSTWLYYLIIAALVGATLVASVLPSKRGHMD